MGNMPAHGFKHAPERFRGEALRLRIIAATVIELRAFFGQRGEMAKVLATEIRAGNLIEWDKRVWRVLKSYHVHVGGRGGAFMQVEMKDIESGTKRNERIRTEDKIERAYVEQRAMQYLYSDGAHYVFMDQKTFEQLTLPGELLEGQSGYLIPNIDVQVNFHNDRPIGVQLPPTVTLTVGETEPNLKSATATGSFKPARTETGLTVMVPQFVSEGERINVNTDTGEYITRA
jgi:elongation factor P